MVKIKLIAVGSIKEKYLKDAIEEYKKRLGRFCSLQITEVAETVANSDAESDIDAALKKDASQINKHIEGYVICMDIEGGQCDSRQFSKKLEKIQQTNSAITFIIGASNGIDSKIKQLANECLSFSKMTFPHQLMRVIFLEQLYRAFTILNNIKYHK